MRMEINLEPAKDVLRSFDSEIAKVEKIRQGISASICAPFYIKDRTPCFSHAEFAPAPDSYRHFTSRFEQEVYECQQPRK